MSIFELAAPLGYGLVQATPSEGSYCFGTNLICYQVSGSHKHKRSGIALVKLIFLVGIFVVTVGSLCPHKDVDLRRSWALGLVRSVHSRVAFLTMPYATYGVV